MLLPDNVHPEQTIYFNGALVLHAIRRYGSIDFLELYARMREMRGISMPVFVLCLDWLFLLNVVTINDKGQVERCF